MKEHREIIATVEGINIYQDEVDKLVSQELFDEANRIYLIRKLALDEYLNNFILNKELGRLNISKKNLIDSLYLIKVDSDYVQTFILNHNMQYGIKALRQSLEVYSVDSEMGRLLLIDKIRDVLLSEYIDSIKGLLKIEKYLYPPVNPQLLQLNNIVKHTKGSENAKIEMIIISDFECDMCKEKYTLIKQIAEENKSNARFSFVNYASYVSTSAIAAEAAARQGRYWEYSDSLFNLKETVTLEVLNRIALNMRLDMNRFISDFKNPQIKEMLENNNNELQKAGIYGTPTMIINGKLIFDMESKNEIQRVLSKELNK